MDAPVEPVPGDGITIPCHDLRDEAPSRVSLALAEREPARCAALLATGRRRYGRVALSIGDRVSRRWLERRHSPYLDEIAAIAARQSDPGTFLLNMSYEWTCTTGTGPDPAGDGCRMLRTLDWPLDELGRTLVVVRRRGEAGDYVDVTWPGFVGVATAMAPGRFAAAINQPPMRKWTSSCWIDWAINRQRLTRARGLPPMHLLRRVLDSCATFDEAKRLLAETPLAVPAFFTLAGLVPGQACVVEREETAVHLHEGPGAVANHFLALPTTGRDRGTDSQGRRRMMLELRETAEGGFDWVRPPILNATTRLACEANARLGTLRVVGIERHGFATRPFDLAGHVEAV